MNRKVTAAVGAAVVSAAIALGAGLGVASATEDPGGGQCNNYGDHSVIIAPFCGLGTPSAPGTSTRTTEPGVPVPSVRPTTTTAPAICAAIFPPLPGCPGYNGGEAAPGLPGSTTRTSGRTPSPGISQSNSPQGPDDYGSGKIPG